MIMQAKELHYKTEFVFRVISRLTSHTSRINIKLFINTASLRDMKSGFATEQHYNIADCSNDEDHITQRAIFPCCQIMQ